MAKNNYDDLAKTNPKMDGLSRYCYQRAAAMKSSGLQGTDYRTEIKVKLKHELKH